MSWEIFNYWISIIFSGVLVGVNPCALVVLWFFFVYLSKNARTPGMIVCGGWIFLVFTVIANIALTFGVLDDVLKQPWSPLVFLGLYAVIALVLAVQGFWHFRDWKNYKFRSISVDQFKIPLPVFLNVSLKAPAAEWRKFIIQGIGTALFLNILGVAWGHDYAVYVTFSQIYFSVGIVFGLMLLAAFFAGYVLPLVVVWTLIARWAKFKGYETLSQQHVAFAKIFQMAVSFSLSIILAVTIARDFFNF